MNDRTQHHILQDIRQCYEALPARKPAPDGEARTAEVIRERVGHLVRLSALFGELGRKVSRTEALG